MTCFDFAYERLDEIPVRKYDSIDENKYDSVVIVPMMDKELHESGFRCLTYLFCKGAEIICKSSCCSDVLHIDGIGGRGRLLTMPGTYHVSKTPSSWRIDCLPNGYLRVFCNRKIINGNGLSDYEVFADFGWEEENDNANIGF